LSVSDPHAPLGRLPRAFVATLSGALFAALVAALLVLMQAIGVRPVRAIEQAGIDLSMWMYANVGWFAGKQPQGLRYAFVDVDRAACKAFLDGASPAACSSDNPVRSALVVDLVRALRAAGAAVVVVDVVPPTPPRERDAWRSAMVAEDGPWIVAPLHARPGDECGDGLSLHGERQADIVPHHAAGRLRLASVATRLDPTLGDGVVRHYPVASRLLLEGEAPRWVPTVPMLAAVLARAGPAAALDATWYAPARPSSARLDCAAATALVASAPLRASDTRFDAQDAAGPEVVRFFFSLPGLSTMDDAERRRIELRHALVYERYVASRLLEDGCTHQLDALAPAFTGCFAVRRSLFEGKLVFIGASSATALDRAQTPAGPMSGPEILVNATRGFAEFPVLRSPDTLTMLASKMKGLIVPVMISLPTWWLIFRWCDGWQARETSLALRRRHAARRLATIAREAGAVLLFVAGLLLTAWWELGEMVQDLSQANSRVEPVEVLLPMLAMGLEGYAAFAKAVEQKFHQLASALVGWGIRQLNRFKRPPR
jgi:hypothetical protein